MKVCFSTRFSLLLSCIQAIVRSPVKTASSLTGGLISIALYYGSIVHIFVSLATRHAALVCHKSTLF